jgi:hypothetical protein
MPFKHKVRKEGQPVAPAQTKRGLVIGSTGHPRVRCVRWDERNFPNVADHDAIVVNSMPLAQVISNTPADESNEMCKRIRANQNTVRVGLLKALGAGKPVYAIDAAESYRKSERHEGPFYFGGMSNREWIPIPVRQEQEEGETLELVDTTLHNYAKFVSRWDHLYYIEQLEQHHWEWLLQVMFGRKLDHYITIESQPVARNSYGRLVAVKLRLAFHRAVQRGYGELAFQREPEFRSGELTLLPGPTECSDRDAVNVLLEDFFGIQIESLPPEWVDVDEAKLPGEEALIGEDEKCIASIQALGEKRGRITKEISDLREYKRLLYETGPALEAICKRVLRELGASVHEAEGTQEDFVLEFRGTKAIVEVKGVTKSISLDDLRQLGQYREDYRLKRSAEVKGVLLGNAWRLVYPSQRQRAFPPNVCKYAEDRGITLATTCSLYHSFCRVREGKTNGEDVLGKLLGGSGRTELS